MPSFFGTDRERERKNWKTKFSGNIMYFRIDLYFGVKARPNRESKRERGVQYFYSKGDIKPE